MTPDKATNIPIRAGLAGAIEKAWARLGQAGTWWSGAERLAIAAETRQAMHCRLCRARKEALSPRHAQGDHDSLGVLSGAAIEAIHHIRTDAGRLTESWLQGLLARDLKDGGQKDGGLKDGGLKDGEYVEIISIVAAVAAVDTFDRAMGLPGRDLPSPAPGEPTRRRPAGVKPGLGWLETLAPEDLADDDPDPYSRFGAYNIQRALSLVPDEVIAFFELDVELYFYERSFPRRRLQIKERALSEAQIELIAARAATINGCYY